jgi:hypothetical protein
MLVKLSANPAAAAAKPETNQAMQDFFSAIEEEQPTMFNPQTGRQDPIRFILFCVASNTCYFQPQSQLLPTTSHE